MYVKLITAIKSQRIHQLMHVHAQKMKKNCIKIKDIAKVVFVQLDPFILQ
jgi:hypothetical protein